MATKKVSTKKATGKEKLAENLNIDAATNFAPPTSVEGTSTSTKHSSGKFLVTEHGKDGKFKQYLSDKEK